VSYQKKSPEQWSGLFMFYIVFTNYKARPPSERK
jgi:hypothetical protein